MFGIQLSIYFTTGFSGQRVTWWCLLWHFILLYLTPCHHPFSILPPLKLLRLYLRTHILVILSLHIIFPRLYLTLVGTTSFWYYFLVFLSLSTKTGRNFIIDFMAEDNSRRAILLRIHDNWDSFGCWISKFVLILEML